MADFKQQSAELKNELGNTTGGSTGMVIRDGVVQSAQFAQGSEPDFDAWLSQQLQFSEPHVDDDGFCERVMAELPAVPAKRAERRATRYQYAAVVAASAIVCWQFPLDQVLATLAEQSISLYSLVGLGILSSMAAMTGGILAARR
ncbi:hypothetical protein [Microbulbifer sp.]|uniref:hypothetical protein n=1 Tax=Microbulbifer sp. TaxID=1908541 RepID=UPI002F91F1C6